MRQYALKENKSFTARFPSLLEEISTVLTVLQNLVYEGAEGEVKVQ